MHWRDESEYKPWLRRVIDAAADHAVRRFHWLLGGLRDFFYYVVTLPGLLLFDWWERFRLADGWARFHNVLMGLPALAVGAVVIFTAVQTSRKTQSSLMQHYHRGANLAAEANDSRKALFLFTAMRELDENSTFATFEMARHYERLGKHDQASTLLRQLTTLGASGDPEAHRWLARMLLRKTNVPYSAELARRHLKYALEVDPTDAEANALMGQLALRQGDAEVAHDFYTKAAKKDGQYNVGLARSMAALGKGREAEMIAFLAEPYFRDRLRINPNDQEARIRMSEIHALRGRHSQAVATLREGLELPNAEGLSDHLARLYTAWGLSLPATSSERWRLWELAFLADAKCPDLVRTLLASGDRDERLRGRVYDLLDRLRENSKAKTEADLMAMLLALSEGDEARAAVHLDRAAASSKKGDEMLADLARIRGLKLALASQWVDLGLKKWPDSNALKRVRGELLFTGGRYAESLLELNSLAPEAKDDPTVHALLADAYTKLGQTEEAAEHRRRAEPLLEVSKAGNGTKR
jgi:tetratricopeptide (TPR) repeat protein